MSISYSNTFQGSVTKATKKVVVLPKMRKQDEKFLTELSLSLADLKTCERYTNILMLIFHGKNNKFAIEEMNAVGPNFLGNVFPRQTNPYIYSVMCHIPDLRAIDATCAPVVTTNESYGEGFTSPLGMALVMKNQEILDYLYNHPDLNPDYMCLGSQHPLTLCVLRHDEVNFKRLLALPSCKEKNPLVSPLKKDDITLSQYCQFFRNDNFYFILKRLEDEKKPTPEDKQGE